MDKIEYEQDYLKISLFKCVNVYENLSASGKTYLPRFAEKFSDAPTIERIATKSRYMRFIRDFNEGRIVQQSEDILFFDRFDLFKSEELIRILQKIEGICILIDFKNYMYLPIVPVVRAVVKYDGKRFEVRSEDTFRR